MAAKTYAIIIGAVLILVGLAGFFVTRTLLFFQVDTVHNLFHLVTGIIFVVAGLSTVTAARLWNQILGVVYALVTIAGFATAGNLAIMQFNQADNWLHLVIAVTALAFGFWPTAAELRRERPVRRAA